MNQPEDWLMTKNIYINNRGFSLLEIVIVIIIITILASAAIPVLSRAYLEKAGTKTALDISAIQDAARAYYINNNAWPGAAQGHTALGDLAAENYLPSTWNAVNPFGIVSNSALYSYNVSVLGPSLRVDTLVPTAAQAIIENLLPASGILPNNNVYSSVPVPGAMGSLPAGMIIPWASNNLPAGFLLCDGTIYNISDYPALANVLGGRFGGDGANTFAVPNMQGKTIFGYQSGDPNFGALGNTGGSATMVGDGQWSSGHADTANWFNQVKISGGSLYGMTGAQTAQGVSTAVLNPYITLNYIVKT